MIVFGSIAVALALGAAIATVLLGLLAGHTRTRRYAVLAEQGMYLQLGLIAVASGILLWAFISGDFSVKYVEGRSDTRMPLHYVLAAFYGGQEGSLLYWVLVSSGFCSAASWVNRGRMSAIMPYFHAVASLGLMGFLFILVFVTPPFAQYAIVDPPVDGSGLNPLLQTPLMTIHPPMLLAGFATAITPFAFGMAALLARQVDATWLRATRRWTLASWLILGVGNILGGMWAYRELGWGGYWAWDAVENAALVPWLVATAFVHSVIIQEQRGLLRRWNVLLVTLYYLLTLVGTWMTRSGLIDSVHTFAESDVGQYFFAHLVVMTVFSGVVIASRWKELRPENEMEDALSREGMFVFNNWLFLGMAAVVMYGTLFPKFAEYAFGTVMTYGAPWFNRVMTPLALLMLLVMALGTILPWRRATLRSFRTQGVPPIIATAITTPLLVPLYWFTRGRDLGVDISTTHAILAIITLALILFNGWILVFEFARGTRARMKTDPNPLAAFLSLFSRHRRRYGGYVAHIGVLMIFLSFIGNVLKAERDVTMRVGDSAQVADIVVRFDGIEVERRRDYIAHIATMTLTRDGRDGATLTPARFDYNDYTRIGDGRGDPLKITSEIYIRSTPLEDIYVVMMNFDESGQIAAFKLEVFPFTVWMWFGGLFLILGTAIAAWPDEDPVSAAWRRERARRDGAPRDGGPRDDHPDHDGQPGTDGTLNQPGAPGRSPLVGVAIGALSAAALAATLWAPAPAHADTSRTADQAAQPVTISEHAIPIDDRELQRLLAMRLELTQAESRVATQAFSMVMASCSGCVGKTLQLASPSCVPSNADKQRIRMMAQRGMTLGDILDAFAAERGQDAVAIPRQAGLKQISWLFPMLFLLAGLAVAIVFLSARRRRAGADANAASTTGTTNGDERPASHDDGGLDDPAEDEYRRRLRDDLLALDR